jgi:Beta-propeller repeat
VAYQRVAGVRKPVNAEYVLAGNGKVQLRIGDYDKRLELVIDPVVSYATYLGGAQGDQANGIAVDSTGNAYVTGQTCSPVFPGSSASLVNCNAFVTKLNPTGTAVVYTTIIGGIYSTGGNAITLDAAGSVYIVGSTNSNSGFPLATNAYYGGDSDAFFAMLDPNGTLLRTSYLGGTGTDSGYGVTVDSATPPNVVGVGQTCGIGRGDFPAYGIPVGVPTPFGLTVPLRKKWSCAPRLSPSWTTDSTYAAALRWGLADRCLGEHQCLPDTSMRECRRSEERFATSRNFSVGSLPMCLGLAPGDPTTAM